MGWWGISCRSWEQVMQLHPESVAGVGCHAGIDPPAVSCGSCEFIEICRRETKLLVEWQLYKGPLRHQGSSLKVLHRMVRSDQCITGPPHYFIFDIHEKQCGKKERSIIRDPTYTVHQPKAFIFLANNTAASEQAPVWPLWRVLAGSSWYFSSEQMAWFLVDEVEKYQ